jgi:5-methylcytosine-specific restriction endonuclease McrA
MELGRDTAMKIWERDYSGETSAKDFKGRLMLKSAYGDEASDYGWDIDHIMPKAQGGGNEMSNLRAANIKSNREKGNNY